MEDRFPRFLMVVTSTALAAGCIITPGRFEALEQQTANFETHSNKQNEHLSQLNERLENLNRLFKSAKDNINRNVANLEADVDEIDTGSQKTRGRTEEILFRLARTERLMDEVVKALAKEHAITISDVSSTMHEEGSLTGLSGETLYEKGIEALQTKEYRKAREFLQQYIDTVPDGSHRADAQFYIGEAFYAEESIDAAVASYQIVYHKYKDTERMPSAVLRLADIWSEKGLCEKAKSIYEALLRENPTSDEAPVATERLKKLPETCKVESN